jgi:deoxycytidylate deaminase
VLRHHKSDCPTCKTADKAVPRVFKRLNVVAQHYANPLNDTQINDWNLLERARELAISSSYDRYPMAAIIAQRNQIISKQTNNSKSHPKQNAHYRAGQPPKRMSTHAELGALLKASKNSSFQPHKATIYVARIGKHKLPNLRCEGIRSEHPPACSYPCEECWDLIAQSGIRRIVCYNEWGDSVEICR